MVRLDNRPGDLLGSHQHQHHLDSSPQLHRGLVWCFLRLAGGGPALRRSRFLVCMDCWIQTSGASHLKRCGCLGRSRVEEDRREVRLRREDERERWVSPMLIVWCKD